MEKTRQRANKVDEFIDFIQEARDGLAAGLEDAPNAFTYNELRNIGKCVNLLDAFLDLVRPNR